MDESELRREVAAIRWWHTIDLGHGVVTPGRDDTPAKLARVCLPEDLTGRTVLDVGAWDGFFSFEAERRGASRVVAVDSFSWGVGGEGSKAGFDLARRVLGSEVEDRCLEVLDVSPQTVGCFDLVLFLGVLYHMRHPLLALERIASVTREQLILETHVEMVQTRQPVMVFYPGNELSNDPSNWWGPNPAAVRAMLLDVGFRRVETVSRTFRGSAPLARLGRAAYNVIEKHRTLFETQGYGRVVLHAWK